MYLKYFFTVITGKRKAFKKERIPINFFTNEEQIGGNLVELQVFKQFTNEG